MSYLRRYEILWCLLIVLLFPIAGYSQFADIPSDQTAVDIGLAGDRASQSHSVTAVVPIKGIDGWVGLYTMQTVADGDAVSELLKGHLQGGVNVGGADVQGFLDAERDKVRGTALQTQVGYFVRFAKFSLADWTVSSGAGNFIESVQAREELDVDDGDPTIRYLVFASAKYNNFALLAKYSPDLHFRDNQLTIEPAFSLQLATNLAFTLRARIGYYAQSLTATPWVSSYIGGLRINL